MPRAPVFSPGRTFIYGVLIFFALLYLTPLYVMLTTSFKNIEEIRNGNLLALPQDPTLHAWIKAWKPNDWNTARVRVVGACRRSPPGSTA